MSTPDASFRGIIIDNIISDCLIHNQGDKLFGISKTG